MGISGLMNSTSRLVFCVGVALLGLTIAGEVPEILRSENEGKKFILAKLRHQSYIPKGFSLRNRAEV